MPFIIYDVRTREHSQFVEILLLLLLLLPLLFRSWLLLGGGCFKYLFVDVWLEIVFFEFLFVGVD